jgi:glutathione S-transferase
MGGLRHLEQCLDGDWLAGRRFSQADLTAGAMLGYVRLRVPEVSLERQFPKLAQFADRCEAMPCFLAARPSPDEVMPG